MSRDEKHSSFLALVPLILEAWRYAVLVKYASVSFSVFLSLSVPPFSPLSIFGICHASLFLFWLFIFIQTILTVCRIRVRMEAPVMVPQLPQLVSVVDAQALIWGLYVNMVSHHFFAKHIENWDLARCQLSRHQRKYSLEWQPPVPPVTKILISKSFNRNFIALIVDFYSINEQTSYHKISWRLEVAK